MKQQADLCDEVGADLSALVDGELALPQALGCLSGSDELITQRWASYQVISESLRAGTSGGLPDDPALTRSIMQAVAREAAVLDLQRVPESAIDTASALRSSDRPANDPVFGWRWWAGAAAGLAALSVTLNVWQFQTAPPGVSQTAPAGALASAPSNATVAMTQPLQPTVVETQVTVTAGQPPQTMLRDPRLDELLQAHRQAGATSALQSPAGFLRNATFQAQQP